MYYTKPTEIVKYYFLLPHESFRTASFNKALLVEARVGLGKFNGEGER
jgi:hypothetical protein